MKYELPPLHQRGGGVIFNTASVAALTEPGGMSAYAASKHGVHGLTRVAAAGRFGALASARTRAANPTASTFRSRSRRAARLAIGDPRKSLEERYKNHQGYVKAVGKAAKNLEKDGFLLPEDVQKVVDEAEASDVLK